MFALFLAAGLTSFFVGGLLRLFVDPQVPDTQLLLFSIAAGMIVLFWGLFVNDLHDKDYEEGEQNPAEIQRTE